MCNFKTEAIIVTGWRKTASIVSDLCERSCWFEVTPLPDDEWEIRTKTENILGRYNVGNDE
jgi:hypothetical protein